MLESHYAAMAAAWLIGLAVWLVISHRLDAVWSPLEQDFERPWVEFAFSLIAAVGILCMGQLWSHGIRLPESGRFGPLLAALNQVLIFLPILLLLMMRDQSWKTAWLPDGRIGVRIGVGLLVAGIATTAYSFLRADAAPPLKLMANIFQFQHIDEFVQVLLEDITIAIVFVRLSAATHAYRATIVVAVLFAAGHLPAMLNQGATLLEVAQLVRDAGLGIAVILVLRRSSDVLWFCFLRFAMDMTQFTVVNDVRL